MTRAPATVLILGGTTEGRALASALMDQPHTRVVTSLAGRVQNPIVVAGQVRSGGFGGAAGLAAWLREHQVRAVIDATHPFASTMTAHAWEASQEVAVPCLRVQRPPWTPEPEDRWISVPSVAQAAQRLDAVGRRALITTGRQTAGRYAHVSAWCLLRSIDPPDSSVPLPQRHQMLLDRGPFTLEAEQALMQTHRIDVLVTKNSGGQATAPKLEAARAHGIPVLMVQRPHLPAGMPAVPTAEQALSWWEDVRSPC